MPAMPAHARNCCALYHGTLRCLATILYISRLRDLLNLLSSLSELQGALTVGTTDGSSMAVPLNVLGNCSRVDTSPTGEVRATLVWAMEDFHPPGSIDPVRSLVHNIDIDIMHAYCMRCHAYARDTMAGQSAEL
jgi:hypothetical protein